MALLSLINWEFYPNRFLYAPIVGIPLTLFIYTIQWFSPINISSGPNGIVVDKGGTLLLIPWEKIDGFEIKELEKNNKLILIIENVPDKRGLFLPKSIDIEVIKKEINENII